MVGKSSKIISVLLAAILVTGTLSACTGQKGKDQVNETTGTSSGSTNETVSTSSGNTSIYPIAGDVKLTYWAGLPVNTSASASTLGDTPFAKELQKKTGITIEYLHPPVGQADEQFNILVSSGDLPDIIEINLSAKYPGGPANAIANNVIFKLNDYIAKDSPGLSKYLMKNPTIDKMAKLDDGSYYMYPFISGDDSLLVSAGPIVRKDWLDDLGLGVPVTIDDWYTMLTAFKEKKSAEAPLSPYWSYKYVFSWGAFAGAYGVVKGFYVDNDKVKYGSIELGYKDFLATMNKWYNEKLLDNNFAALTTATVDANMLDGKSGATVASGGSGLTKWLTAMKDKDPKFSLVGVEYPVLNKGDKPQFGQYGFPVAGSGASITTACKNVDAAAKFLDYAYTDEGHQLFNFGIEGVSYTMDNGKPKYTDEIMNNPSKLSPAQALSIYAMAPNGGQPFVQDREYIAPLMSKAQSEAVAIWSATDMAKHMLPPINVSASEKDEYAKIMNDVTTYEEEMLLKFILGTEPLSNFDKYVEQMKKLEIDKAISMQQSALDKYNKR